jgi:uncharacterized protein (TIGR03663 family)
MTKTERRIWFGIGLLALGALLIRFVHLGDKPLHHDESLHAFYGLEVFRGNGYEYNPITHGPLLFILVAFTDWLVGVSDAGVRFGTALFGWALVMMPFILRKDWGMRVSVIAMVLLALSPNMLYVSRFLRHDPLMHVWTFALVIALYRYIRAHRPLTLLLIGVLSAFAFSTSETSYITFFMLATFLFGGALFETVFKRDSRLLRDAVRSLGRNWKALLGMFAIFAGISVVFYSTFFTNWEGVKTALPNPFDPNSGLGYWIAQHDVRRGGQPWYYYFLSLGLYEFVPLIIGVVGSVYLLLKKPTLLGSMLLWWLILFLVIYSWAGEKFPWLVTYPLIPLILVASYALKDVTIRIRMRAIAPLTVVVVMFSFWVYSAFRLSFQNPADPREFAVYVQTTKDVVRVANLIRSDALLRGTDVVDAHVEGELTWPFAWYLRDVPIRSYDKELSAPPTAKYLLVSQSQEPQWKPYLEAYNKIGERYQLRAWWVPPVAREQGYTIRELTDYFLDRTIWGNPEGSVLFSVYERRQ